DALPKIALALAEPLGDLVQRPPPLALVDLDLAARGGSRLLRGPLEFLPQLRKDRPLILAGGLELLCVSFQSRLCLGDRVALALGELAETRCQPLLHPVEVACPFAQALLDTALDEGHRLAELGGEAPLTRVQLAQPCVGELAVLLGQARGRIGASARAIADPTTSTPTAKAICTAVSAFTT